MLRVAEMDQHLDMWNLMAYDYSGSWSPTAAHSSNLHGVHHKVTPFDTDQAIAYYTAEGVKPHKIVLGMPLYGHSFTNTDGLGSPFHGTGPGSWEDGVWDFKALPRPGATEHTDLEAAGSYSYDPTSRTMISYDNQQVAKLKADYIKAKGLGGAMWWESSGDRCGSESLIGTVCQPDHIILLC
jgi:chitinase